MTSDELDRVERELGIRLPSDYRALVLTYPAGLGASGPDYELLDDPIQLIAINRLFREQGSFGLPWPAWPSLEAWLTERRAEQAEWEEESRQRMARKASKRWWQFWI